MLEALANVLTEAINDEYKARATYRLVIGKYGEIRPFTRIVEAESRHIEALLPLFEKYGIQVPNDDWESRVEVPASVKDACQEGVQAEKENAEMYERSIAATHQYPDVQAVLKRLQRSSSKRHIAAFQRCVERVGNSTRGRRKGQQNQRFRKGH